MTAMRRRRDQGEKDQNAYIPLQSMAGQIFRTNLASKEASCLGVKGILQGSFHDRRPNHHRNNVHSHRFYVSWRPLLLDAISI